MHSLTGLFLTDNVTDIAHISMAHEPIHMTDDGLQKLKAELQELKTVRRREIAERLEAAKALGDLSENADYQQAKEDSAWVEGRINQLNDLISRAVVAGAPTVGVVSIGSTVRVTSSSQEKEFSIVGATEANPSAGKISSDSPIGSALLGAKVGDEVTVKTPGGEVVYRVERVE